MTRRVEITRENLLNGTLYEWARARMGPGVRLMSPEERAAQIGAVLERARGRVWIFGYGSLMWNPAFHFAERRAARVHGWHRRFCLWTRAGRGSHELPGLMLGLEPGGGCRGVVYRLPRGAEATELDVVWRREMLMMSYRPVWVRAHTPKGTLAAIAFAVSRAHDRYAGRLGEATVVHHLATAAGPFGSCSEYLSDTVAHLRELGIRDRRLEALERKVRGYRPR